jgi:TonB family protein
MNDHKEHISQYSAADIQRYVQGKLSAAEMHAMEKAALDDPFLADAIEGMQLAFEEHTESQVTGKLEQLHQQFQTRTTGKARVVAFKPFRYWQAAAAAVIVIISGVWIYSLVNRNTAGNSSPVIAKTENQQQQQAPAPSLADGKEITINTDSVLPPVATPKTNDQYREKQVVTRKETAPTISERLEQSANVSKFSQQAQAEPQKQVLDNPDRYFANTEKKEVLAGKKGETPTAAPAAAAAPVLAKSQRNDDEKLQEREAETELITIAKPDSKFKKAATKDKNLSGFIKGQVTDPFNNPVANAYVQIQKNNNNNFLNNLTTDKSGFFKIPVSDSVVNVAVNVSGYGTQSFILQNNAAVNQLQLQPANYTANANNYTPTAPVTANGRKQLANNYKFPNVMVYEAEPAYGWVAFGQYLEKNKKIPAGADSMSGNVVVSFEVNKKGNLADFKIEQSLSKLHDEEAIRLINQGPSWKLRSGRKARVTVMVRF